VSLAGLGNHADPAAEWREIFAEVWRRYRDYFYVENMHGYDWQKLRAKYQPLLDFVGSRADLNYVIAEMISELTVQHAYIEGGDLGLPKRPLSRCPGRASNSTQNPAAIDRQDFRRSERRGALPVAAHGSGRGCPCGRLRALDQWA